MRIDSHVHVFTQASTEFPREVSKKRPAEREESAEKLLGLMDLYNVDRAVLVQTGGDELIHHAYLKHCLNAYPDRFYGIGLIPKEIASPEEHMDRLAANGRILGFRLRHVGGPSDPFAPVDVRQLDTYRIWQHAANKDYVLWLYICAADTHLVPYLVEAFPQVRVVFNHLMVCPGTETFYWDNDGRPQVDTSTGFPASHYSLLGLREYDNVCVHLSGQYAVSKEKWPYRDLTGIHERLLSKTFGANRLMWATDFPWITENPGYKKMTLVIDELLPGLTGNERNAIMGQTAERFLRLR